MPLNPPVVFGSVGPIVNVNYKKKKYFNLKLNGFRSFV